MRSDCVKSRIRRQAAEGTCARTHHGAEVCQPTHIRILQFAGNAILALGRSRAHCRSRGTAAKSANTDSRTSSPVSPTRSEPATWDKRIAGGLTIDSHRRSGT